MTLKRGGARLLVHCSRAMEGWSWAILLLLSVAFVGDCLTLEKRHDTVKKLKNVLFIAIDDLRTELGTNGHTQMVTPNFDSLASKSLVFERVYCQVAVCSPSRTSLLMGRRPDTNHVWMISVDEYWRHFTNAATIPQYFNENGYISIGMGKIYMGYRGLQPVYSANTRMRIENIHRY